MSAVLDFEVLGTVTEYGKVGGGLRIIMSRDGDQLALARVEEGKLVAVRTNGPYTLEKLRTLAENVLAGHPQAITWPQTAVALALFTCSQFLLAERALREQADATSPGAAEAGATEGAAPPPETSAAGQPSLFGRSS